MPGYGCYAYIFFLFSCLVLALSEARFVSSFFCDTRLRARNDMDLISGSVFVNNPTFTVYLLSPFWLCCESLE
jgi:hypothetical protein